MQYGGQPFQPPQLSSKTSEKKKKARDLRCPLPSYPTGPTEAHDSFGYTVAIALLQDSRRPGKHDPTHLQWNTIRHLKSTIANQERQGDPVFGPLALVNDSLAATQHFQSGGTSSRWYQLFTRGIKNRTGAVVKKNLALDTKLIVEVIKRCELCANSAPTIPINNQWIMAGACLTFSYVFSLRGNEGFMIDIKELNNNRGLKKKMVWIILSGKVKGQGSPTLHELRSVPVTNSGINDRDWRDKLLLLHDKAGRKEGPAICDSDGFVLSMAAMNELFWTIFEEIYDEDPEAFPKAISSVDDIREMINIYRTLCRSSNTHVMNGGKVSTPDINIVERWRKRHLAQGKEPGEEMHVSYAEQEIMNKCFWRYTLNA